MAAIRLQIAEIIGKWVVRTLKDRSLKVGLLFGCFLQ